MSIDSVEKKNQIPTLRYFSWCLCHVKKAFPPTLHFKIFEASPLPRRRDLKNSKLSPLYRFWDMKKYVGIMKVSFIVLVPIPLI